MPPKKKKKMDKYITLSPEAKGTFNDRLNFLYLKIGNYLDTEFLKTLDAENICSGYAEMLKHGLISTEAMWEELVSFDLDQPDLKQLQRMVGDSVKVKERIVELDPHEKGIRKALNLGHTFGHAFESWALKRKPILHGYAVAFGLIPEHDARQLEECDRSLYVKGASNVSAVEDGLLKCGSRADRWGGRGNDNASEYGERCGEKMLHNLEKLWKYLFEPHEEEEVRARLQLADERRLVDVVEVLQADALEVLHAVRYLLGSHGGDYSTSFLGGRMPYKCRGRNGSI